MYRPDYPRPQMVRGEWLNLNGEWAFDFDDANKGIGEKWYKEPSFSQKIMVPFAYQTKLSGVYDTGFHDYIWYHRTFKVPNSMKGKRVILHFGAVDYLAYVYLNGELIGTHEGGHTPFNFDITHFLNGSVESLTVRVYDPSTDETIPRGKQFWEEHSASIWYTRTSGIWQTVWLEAVDETHVKNIRFTPDVDAGSIEITFEIAGNYHGKDLDTVIHYKGELISQTRISLNEAYVNCRINLFNKTIFRTERYSSGWVWSPENPNLFDVRVLLMNKEIVLDDITTYFGMRKVHTENGMVYLNNRPYYQKLVLDQGYWPEGLLTAPSDDALKNDIILAKEMGFNGCRKHQKIEDPRFLYWADQLGYLVWGECAAAPSFSETAVARITKEWIEIVERDYNHPCIVTWVPINESWGVANISYSLQQASHSLGLYYLIKSLDSTRLVVSNDGWEMTKTDICAIHNYNHGNKNEKEKYAYFIESLKTKESILASRPANRSLYVNGFRHEGEPILLTEFGGIGFIVDGGSGWGYTTASDEAEFIDEYKRIMEALCSSRALHGYCYTQLTDVEQEINGILTYDRKPKCNLAEINKLNNMWSVPIIYTANHN